MSKVLDKRVEQFNLIKESLFPDGVITPVSEIQERIAAGTHTVRDGLIARFYAKGIAIDPGLLKRDETKEFAQAMQESFPVSGGSPSRNVEGFAGVLGLASRNNIPLDSSFSELDQASKSTDFNTGIRTKIVSPIRTDVTSVSEGKLVRPSSSSGKKKLARGAVPPGVLKGIMDGIGDIPDPVMRDAVVASMLGLRGTDLSGIATTAELAEETFPARPYYDPETGTLISPDPELPGKGRKGAGPDRPLGPVMKQIMDRRYAAAVDGELFPDIDTKKIAAALNEHVYTKIDKKTLAVLKKQPSGYTDIRRIVASAIANQLGDPQAAAEIISHTGADGAEKIDRVMTGFYTDVENLDSLEARRSALVGFESLMADATGSSNAKSLGQYLRLGLPEKFNAEYPKLEIKGSKVGSAVQVTEATPEQIEAGRQLDLAQTSEKTETARANAQRKGKDADLDTIARGENATAVAEAEFRLKQAGKEVTQGKAAEATAQKAAAYKDTLKSLMDLYGKVPGPVKKGIAAIPYFGSAISAEMTRSAVTQQAEALGLPSSVAGPVGVAAGATEFLPVAPSDVIEVGRSMASPVADPGSARPIERVMADQPELFQNNEPAAPTAQSVPSAPVNIPDPVPSRQGMLSAGGAKQRVNQARSAALAGQETSMSGSFLN